MSISAANCSSYYSQTSVSSNESTIIIEIFSVFSSYRQVSMSHPACKKSSGIIILLWTRLLNFYSEEFMGDWFFCTTCAARTLRSHRCNRRCSTGIDRMLHAMTEVDNVSLLCVLRSSAVIVSIIERKFEQPDEDETARCRWISHGVIWMAAHSMPKPTNMSFGWIRENNSLFTHFHHQRFDNANRHFRAIDLFVQITNENGTIKQSILRSDRVL